MEDPDRVCCSEYLYLCNERYSWWTTLVLNSTIASTDGKMNHSTDDSWPERAFDIGVRLLLVVWLLLLVPWLMISLLAGMAFDSGNTVAAILFVVSVWSYGPAVFGAFKLLHRSRKSVLLLFISIAGIFLSDFLMVPSRY